MPEKPENNYTNTCRESNIPRASSDSLKGSLPTVSRAYEARRRSVISTLSFFIPIICLLSCIPIALAWTHSPQEVGTAKDANFYQLVANALIQLLSLATLLWPTLFHSTFSGHSWLWTWTLAVFSGICTIMSVPLYVFLPNAWSIAVAFGGMIAQILILLQIVHAI